MVEHELKEHKFDARIVENRQYLYQALTDLYANSKTDNMPQIYAILQECKNQNVSIDDELITQNLKNYINKTTSKRRYCLNKKWEKR